MTEMKTTDTTSTETLYCYVHPDRETTLRCNNCNRPICAWCAVRTPTGYRCKECVRGQQKIFDTAQSLDYIFGFLATGILSFLASLLVGVVSAFGIFAWILIIIGAPAVGAVIAEAVRYAIRHHRSRPLFIAIMVGMALGAVPAIVLNLITLNIFGLIFQAIYLVLAAPTVYYRLSGLQLFR